MKNIILQHWTGDLNEITTRSSANIARYAASVGANYRLLRGQVFRPKLTPACQKVYMLNEEFDVYDWVVMLDPDMFIRKGLTENIFTDVQGIGLHIDVQTMVMNGLKRKHPKLINPQYPFWGGAIYRLPRELRQTLRVHMREKEMAAFGKKQWNGEDEGIMHRLATLANIKDPHYLPGNRWCYCSYRPNIETAALIHIRTKVTPKGPKRTKMENYMDLVRKGVIEE